MSLSSPHRRSLLAATLAVAAAPVAQRAFAATPALPGAPPPGLDAAQLGVRPNAGSDQTRALRAALERAAGAPLTLAAGTYRLDGLVLPSGARLVSAPGAARLQPSGAGPMIFARDAAQVGLIGLAFDGGALPLQGTALLQFENCRDLLIEGCAFTAIGGNALNLTRAHGAVRGNSFAGIAATAIHAMDSAGLSVTQNALKTIGANGIEIWRGAPGHDGSIVADNRIENVAARQGGSGQYGNAINVFRAGGVIVRGNALRDCAFSAVRGNAASDIQIAGNTATRIGEVALYAEFGFEGAAITGNIVDGASLGVSVTNFNEGGRLAVVQGNLIRNLFAQRPSGTDPNDAAGVGIAVEADSAVTGNAVEGAPLAGILAGSGRWQRDIAITGNVIRRCGIGIGASVAPGAGAVLIASNVIAESERGAILGMDGKTPVSADLADEAARRYPHLTIAQNRTR